MSDLRVLLLGLAVGLVGIGLIVFNGNAELHGFGMFLVGVGTGLLVRDTLRGVGPSKWPS